MEQDPEYYMHSSAREKYRNISFYDQTTKWAGYPELMGKYRGEIWFQAEEYGIVEKWMEQFKGKFVVMVNLSGTTIHKRFIAAQEVIDYIVNKYDDAHIILTGDESCGEIKIKCEKMTSIVGKFPFRQALHITRYIDLLLSMESGIAVGANTWGTPTIQLMTSSSLINHPNGAKADFSLQSPARCSPCCKGPYRFIGCPHKDGYPLCVYFDPKEICKKVDEVYGAYQDKRFPVEDRLSTKNDAGVSIMRNATTYHHAWNYTESRND
jgi:ADP-heptose:LPS heptosyltransferase